ncbi:bifunctional DNA-formamidopyrimidine glycosylase/DNA-(apurinic or apyrimidinic site) lyase [Petrachloros mirabilis]
MPELPEAEVVGRQLRKALVGATLVDCWIGRADIVREGLKSLPWYRGALVQGVKRFGKSVALELVKDDTVRYIVAELGMTGLLLFPSAHTKLPQHVHVRMTFSGGAEKEVRYWNPRRFGRVSLLDQVGLDRYVARRFGSDPMTVSLEEFQQLFKNRRGRLKPLLMQQQVLAGIGNIYANEILFRMGLHPNVPADRLSQSQLERLYDVMRRVLREAIDDGGSSVRDFFAPNGSEGRYKQRHLVYGKEGQPCPSGCGQVLRRLRGERSSFFCPSCQRKKADRGKTVSRFGEGKLKSNGITGS